MPYSRRRWETNPVPPAEKNAGFGKDDLIEPISLPVVSVNGQRKIEKGGPIAVKDVWIDNAKTVVDFHTVEGVFLASCFRKREKLKPPTKPW
jgi:hypothetical protein